MTAPLVHMTRPSGEPRPGVGALCGADHRHGVLTTYSRSFVTCDACQELMVAADGEPAVTPGGRVLGDADFEVLADEAE